MSRPRTAKRYRNLRPNVPHVRERKYCVKCNQHIPYKRGQYDVDRCPDCRIASRRNASRYARNYNGKYKLGSFVEINPKTVDRWTSRVYGYKRNKRYRVTAIWWTDDGMVWFTVGKGHSGLTSSMLMPARKQAPERRNK